jgi:hypothetical protein
MSRPTASVPSRKPRAAFLPEGRHQQRVAVLLGRVMRRDQRREDRDQHQQQTKTIRPITAPRFWLK